MTTHAFMNERVDVSLKRSFEQAEALLDENVPPADVPALVRLAESRASASEMEGAVQRMQGDLDFMTFAKIPQGTVTSVLGTSKKITVYLVGNPVIANRMFERNRAVGLYAPLRVALYEDKDGIAHFTYDRPSSLLRSFEDQEVDGIARRLDDKLTKLAERLA